MNNQFLIEHLCEKRKFNVFFVFFLAMLSHEYFLVYWRQSTFLCLMVYDSLMRMFLLQYFGHNMRVIVETKSHEKFDHTSLSFSFNFIKMFHLVWIKLENLLKMNLVNGFLPTYSCIVVGVLNTD